MSVYELLHSSLLEVIPIDVLVSMIIEYCNMHMRPLPRLKLLDSEMIDNLCYRKGTVKEIDRARKDKQPKLLDNSKLSILIAPGQIGIFTNLNFNLNFIILDVEMDMTLDECNLKVAFVEDMTNSDIINPHPEPIDLHKYCNCGSAALNGIVHNSSCLYRNKWLDYYEQKRKDEINSKRLFKPYNISFPMKGISYYADNKSYVNLHVKIGLTDDKFDNIKLFTQPMSKQDITRMKSDIARPNVQLEEFFNSERSWTV